MKIFVCYPVRSVGGAQNLLLRTLENLSLNKELDLVVCDFHGGYISRSLTTLNINYQFIDFLDVKKLSFDENTVFFTPLSEISNFGPEFLSENVRIFAWGIHPSGILSFFKFKHIYTRLPLSWARMFAVVLEGSRFRRVRRFIDELMTGSSLVVMDDANENAILKFCGIQKSICQIPIGLKILPIRRRKCSDLDNIEYIWLGRVDKDKYASIIHVAYTLSFVARSQGVHIKLHVVGEGDCLGRLKTQTFDFLELVFPGSLMGNNLMHYTQNICFVGFAMGTSVLELVNCNVLTFTVDLIRFRRPLPLDNIYIFSGKNNGYLGDAAYSRQSATTLSQFSSLISNYETIIEKQRNFMVTKFDISANTELVFKCLTSGRTKWADVRGLI